MVYNSVYRIVIILFRFHVMFISLAIMCQCGIYLEID